MRCYMKSLPIKIVLVTFALSGLLVATSAQNKDADAPSSVVETYGDWVVRCTTPEEGSKVCEMTQELKQEGSNQRVLAISIKPEKKDGLTIIAPFGLSLAKGIKVEVDEVLLLMFPYKTALRGGCIGVADLSDKQVKRLVKGEQAAVLMYDMNNEEFRVDVSLEGFAAAWKRLNQLKR